MDDEFFDIPSDIEKLHRDEHVIINLRPVANAPILKKTKFQISGSEPFSMLISFVKGQLKCKDQVFLYINSSFCPPADAIIGDLHKSFKISDELMINYAISEAWG